MTQTQSPMDSGYQRPAYASRLVPFRPTSTALSEAPTPLACEKAAAAAPCVEQSMHGVAPTIDLPFIHPTIFFIIPTIPHLGSSFALLYIPCTQFPTQTRFHNKYHIISISIHPHFKNARLKDTRLPTYTIKKHNIPNIHYYILSIFRYPSVHDYSLSLHLPLIASDFRYPGSTYHQAEDSQKFFQQGGGI